MNSSLTTPEAQSNRLTYDVQDLSFRYRGPLGTWAVKGMSFTVVDGEIFGIIGPNGCGKSSLLKLLAHMLEPQAGVVRLYGEPLARWSRQAMARQVAYMPQDVASDFAFSALDMVLMGRFPYRQRQPWDVVGWETTEDHAVVEQAMVQTDVIHLAGRDMGTLSAGERQRVLLARALAQQPRVLLLDEPTAHLDLQHQLDFCRILKRVHGQRRITVILVSHDINLAGQYCDDILMMKHGRWAALGAPHEVITPVNLQDVYGCRVLVDRHPETGMPRVCLPSGEALTPNGTVTH